MLTVKNLTQSDVSIDTLCLRLSPGESLEFMFGLSELRSLHPDIATLLDRGHLAALLDVPPEEKSEQPPAQELTSPPAPGPQALLDEAPAELAADDEPLAPEPQALLDEAPAELAADDEPPAESDKEE